MEIVKLFHDQTVYIDSSPFIYHIEGNANYKELLSVYFNELDQGSFFALTSALAFLEVLVIPYKHERKSTIQLFENLLLNTWNLKMFPVDADVARLAARLRAEYTLMPADAIHLASAVHHKADIFLTNDKRLKKVKQCRVLCLDDLQSTM